MSVTPAGPPPYGALIVQYALIALYAAGASFSGVYTLKVVSGEAWETIWPALLFVAALLALVGVIRSYRTSKHGWEVGGTLALVALLAGYVLAIVVYGASSLTTPDTCTRRFSRSSLPCSPP